MPNFNNLNVAALESRRAKEMAKLIERYQGTPFVSPSMREVPLEKNPEAIDFAHRLLVGEVDVVILLTGVGLKHLVTAVERHVDKQRFLDSLSDIVTVCRGPKPLAALKELGLSPTHVVPEPNTWRELLDVVDEKVPIANRHVVMQEYGKSNASLIAGLEARGATVENLKVYRWELPEDTQPLQDNLKRMIAGEVDVLLFTSANQVTNMLRLATRMQVEAELRIALQNILVVSIGPTTTEMLEASEIPVDLEPDHPKMGQLVKAAAEQSSELLKLKRQAGIRVQSPQSKPDGNQPTDGTPAWYESPFMRACRREPTTITPVWLMRQAGRYMAEYRAVRSKTTFLELCKDPAMCSEVMCTAVDKLGVDAAIIFSDLLPILEPMGLDLEFAQGEGPVIHNPVRTSEDVDRVLELETLDKLDFVMETVTKTRADLPENLPLIGFAGAPFTLASYTIEGGSSRNYIHTKTLMYRDPAAWRALMDRFSRAVSSYLTAQIEAGAQCVQIFDSWAGCLGVEDYRRHVLPHMQTLFAALPQETPVIHFATGNPALLPQLSEALGARRHGVVGIDWRIPLDDAWTQVGSHRAVQGNLDPLALLAGKGEIRRRAAEVLSQAAGRPGHIFNLGHGVLQQTPVENAIELVKAVHELSERG
jgi:uroporphyrinogen decarboxylase